MAWLHTVVSRDNNVRRERLTPYRVIAERISDWQIIVQQVRRYSRVLVCMYVCMSSILPQTATYEKRVVSIDLTYKYCRIDCHHYNPKPSPTTTKYVSSS